MGEKDITEKILEDHNDVFADIINGLLFDGVQEIKPEDLENTTVHAQYKAEDDKVHELERDIAKYWKEEKVELAICGIENQSKVEKHMPFRIIGYDGAAYRNQLQQERRKMLPVVTIVLYFGTDRHWSSRKKIKELMEIPRCLDMYVNDYQMHVFEVAWLTEEQISRFHSDFKVVANFFVQKRKNRDYIPDDPTEIRHVDEVLKLLKVMTGDRRYEEIFRKKKGVRSMCDVAEKVRSVGAQLVNANGEAYIHPLETRDVNASGVIRECSEGRGVEVPGGAKGVWLDTPMIEILGGEGTIEKRIPAMFRMYMNYGIDMRKVPIVIYPTLHYQNGGLEITGDGFTKEIPNLLVAGEAAGGIHGTNRLMGNSLLDVIVFGRNAGKKAAAKYKDVELGEMNLDHVKAYDEELKEAGVETNEVSPMLLPHYARHERKITGEVVSA